MKNFTRLRRLRISYTLPVLPLLLVMCFSGPAKSQCTTGYNQVTLNWDYLDFLIYTANYTTGQGYLINIGWAQTQNFAFGTQRLTINHNYAAGNFSGENATHSSTSG